MKAFTALTIAAVFILPAVVGCDDDDGTAPPTGPPPNYSYELEVAFPNLTFVQPVDLQHAGDASGRLFVVEKRGVISVFDNDPAVQSAETFLDISSRVTAGGERGLLGLAFHPDYETNGYFFIYYSPDPGLSTRIARFQVSAANPDSADEGSEIVLLDIPQQYSNHNGGQVGFDPDGYLCIAVGDEGSAGDPNDNAQDLTTLHGSILRLDVDSQALGNYGIPATNPFAINTKGFRPEIYAYGLRNPWRFSFDPATGRMWAGDVGQNSWEEIDVIVSGGNYGWDCREGMHDYNPSQQSPLCDTVTTAIDPVHEYPTGSSGSVTGGHVYRGPTLTSLRGVYVFADYISGQIWGLVYDGQNVTNVTELVDTTHRIASFGVDEDNELYICAFDFRGGPTQIYRLKQVAD
jgi:glucose/arabinose dehydrogenase